MSTIDGSNSSQIGISSQTSIQNSVSQQQSPVKGDYNGHSIQQGDPSGTPQTVSEIADQILQDLETLNDSKETSSKMNAAVSKLKGNPQLSDTAKVVEKLIDGMLNEKTAVNVSKGSSPKFSSENLTADLRAKALNDQLDQKENLAKTSETSKKATEFIDELQNDEELNEIEEIADQIEGFLNDLQTNEDDLKEINDIADQINDFVNKLPDKDNSLPKVVVSDPSSASDSKGMLKIKRVKEGSSQPAMHTSKSAKIISSPSQIVKTNITSKTKGVQRTSRSRDLKLDRQFDNLGKTLSKLDESSKYKLTYSKDTGFQAVKTKENWFLNRFSHRSRKDRSEAKKVLNQVNQMVGLSLKYGKSTVKINGKEASVAKLMNDLKSSKWGKQFIKNSSGEKQFKTNLAKSELLETRPLGKSKKRIK